MFPKTIKYGPGEAVKARWFNGKKHLYLVTYGPIWRIWVGGSIGYHQTY